MHILSSFQAKSQAKGRPGFSKIKGIENSMQRPRRSIPARPSDSLLEMIVTHGATKNPE
jgi:hypothetical protein